MKQILKIMYNTDVADVPCQRKRTWNQRLDSFV